MNEPIIGIDLGTTNSLVGIFDAGFSTLIADSEGHRLTPSAVLLPEQADGEVVVGRAALRQRGIAPRRLVLEAKRLIGRRRSEIDRISGSYDLAEDEKGMAGVRWENRFWSPEEISSCLLRKLKSDAEAALGRSVGRAVITVPAYFNDAQRGATKRAGELAGLSVERIVSEPTAAALAHGLQRLGEHSKIAVFDLGGGTFDLSILECSGGIFEVLATHGSTTLGGGDIDRILVEWAKNSLDLDSLPPGDEARLLEAVESLKVRLSREEEARVPLPFLEGVPGAELCLSRQELNRLADPVLAGIPPLCRRAMQDAGVSGEELERVLLVGGATRMPAVRQLASSIFQTTPDTSEHPDEAIALGACIQGGILSGAASGITLLDVTPLSLGIETYGGLMNILIPRNTSIPCKAGEMFTNAAANQTSMSIRVLQGERELAKDNWTLGMLEVPFTPAPKGSARVGVQFSIDENGILEVLVRDVATGRDEVVAIDSAVHIEEEKVERMIEESVEQAIPDMNQRIFQESKIKAEELLGALEVALSQLEDDLSNEEREALAALDRETREAIAAGSHQRLKTAVNQLEEATDPLAEKLLEKLAR